MFKVFKCVHGVLAGAYCAAVVMCGGVIGVTMAGTNDANWKSEEQLFQEAPDHLLPLCISLPHMISAKPSISPFEWREMFLHVKEGVYFVVKNNENPNFQPLNYMIYCLCDAKNSLIAFCSSDQCDADVVPVIASLLSLFPKALSFTPQNSDTNELISEFKVFNYPENLTQDDLKRLITDELLSRVALQLEPVIFCYECD